MDNSDRLAPLYAQVKQRLSARIESGALAEGDFLPAEPELCAEMGVSRITVRRAVKELCDEGILIRQQGRGTLVARRKVQQTLVSLSGFSEAFEAEGSVSHAILNVVDDAADPAARQALGADRITRIERLISVDDRPFTLETLCLDPATMADVIEPVRKGQSFFRTLRRLGKPEPVAADRILNVGFAAPDQRRHLGIGPTQPVFLVDKTVLGPDARPISFSRLVTPTHLITYAFRS